MKVFLRNIITDVDTAMKFLLKKNRFVFAVANFPQEEIEYGIWDSKEKIIVGYCSKKIMKEIPNTKYRIPSCKQKTKIDGVDYNLFRLILRKPPKKHLNDLYQDKFIATTSNTTTTESNSTWNPFVSYRGNG